MVKKTRKNQQKTIGKTTEMYEKGRQNSRKTFAENGEVKMDEAEEKIEKIKQQVLNIITAKNGPILVDEIVKDLWKFFYKNIERYEYNRAIKELEKEEKIIRKECLISL